MAEVNYGSLRRRIADGVATMAVTPLEPALLHEIAWSGSRTHLDNVGMQLRRVAAGDVVYLTVRADGHAVSKGGVDFAAEPGAATIWQIATHEQLEGLGLASRLMVALEDCAVDRGLCRIRLAVEIDNVRARRLYEHLGYHAVGEAARSWEAEAADGSRFTYCTTVTEMEKTA